MTQGGGVSWILIYPLYVVIFFCNSFIKFTWKKNDKKDVSKNMSCCHFLLITVIAIMLIYKHCMKSVSIWINTALHFPAFRLNMKRYSASLRIQSEWGKMQTRKTLNTDTFYTVKEFFKNIKMSKMLLRIAFVKLIIFCFFSNVTQYDTEVMN